MQTLKGKVVIAGGASRGAARGIALALGEAGATVYVAARTSRAKPNPLVLGTVVPGTVVPGTVEDTAEEVTARGGVGIPVPCDLAEEGQVDALLRRVESEQGRLDLFANGAWGADFLSCWSTPYWELDPAVWRDTVHTMNTYWLTTVHATRLMAKRGSGVILHVTDNFPDDASKYRGQILHDIAHEFINRLVHAAAPGAREVGVAVAGLNPGFMRTERVLLEMKTEEIKERFRFHLSESVEFIGRAARALLSDPNVLRKSGKLLWASDLAEEYGFTDVDGKIPRFDYSHL